MYDSPLSLFVIYLHATWLCAPLCVLVRRNARSPPPSSPLPRLAFVVRGQVGAVCARHQGEFGPQIRADLARLRGRRFWV